MSSLLELLSGILILMNVSQQPVVNRQNTAFGKERVLSRRAHENILGREPMTIALVDDSDSDIKLLYDYLSRYCHDHHVYITIEKFTNEHTFLNSMQDKVGTWHPVWLFRRQAGFRLYASYKYQGTPGRILCPAFPTTIFRFIRFPVLCVPICPLIRSSQCFHPTQTFCGVTETVPSIWTISNPSPARNSS